MNLSFRMTLPVQTDYLARQLASGLCQPKLIDAVESRAEPCRIAKYTSLFR